MQLVNMAFKQNIFVWMPEFVEAVTRSKIKLIEEGVRLNRLAAILEAKNKEKEE